MAIGYSDNIRSQVVQICTPELLHQALKSNRVKTVCAQLADALESKLRGEICNDDYEEMKKKLKSQLPILTPHATFRNGRRKNDEATPSGLSIYDIDHIPNPRGYWEEKKKVLANKMLGGTKASSEQASCVLDLIVLVHVTPSTQGLRLVFIIPEGMDIAMAQRWMSQQLEDSEYDTVVKDLARPSFLVPEEYLLYINEEELFKERKITPQNSNHKVQSSNLNVQSNENVQNNLNVQSNENVQNNRFQGTNGDNAVSAGAAVQPAQPGNSHRVNDSHLGSAGASQDAGGVATQNASEKNLIAFELFKEAAGLKGMEIDTIGSRHSSLLAIMSAGASRVMSEDELMKVVAKKMPSYYEERDCHQLIHDFYAKYGDSSKPFSRDVMRINATAEKQAAVNQVNSLQLKVESSNLNVQSFQNAQGDEVHYPDPPAMPTKLPKLVEHLISNTPDFYKPAVAHAIFPPLATHLWNTRFRYIDNVEHEATLATVLLASTGAGKSCVQKPIEYIMEDIRKRDAENLKREKEWKDEVVRKGANKDKRKRPDNLIIQEIDADMTNPAFVMRTAEAQGHFLYTSLNEIDLFDALKGNGGQQFRIMCLAFDPSNKYGQTRVGSQSVTDRVTIRFNWNASSTIQKGQRYFSKVLTDGPISRINFCTIPEREIGEEMPVYGTYDEAYREGLKPYIENLCQASGLVECEEAFQLALKLKEEHAEFSRLSQDRTYENLSFRANVIGYLKACVLYVANGYRWEPEIEEFIRWSEQYDLYCKMKFFGDAIKRANGSDEKTSKRGPASLLQQLPDVFSFQQAEFLRSQLGMNRSGTVSMLRNWVNRNYVKKIPPQGAKGDVISIQLFSFEKLRNRKDGKVVDMLNS